MRAAHEACARGAYGSARSVRRLYETFRRPESIADVVFWVAAVEACFGLPLKMCRLFEMVLSESYLTLSFATISRISLFRCFIIFCGLSTVLVASFVYQELETLHSSSAGAGRRSGRERRWHLSEQQQGSLQRGGRIVVFMCTCLMFLHILDVLLTRDLAEGLVGRGLLWGFYCLLPLNILFVPATAAVYCLHWSRHRGREPFVDLNVCSRTVAWDLEEVCCICLCCPAGTEVVSTLPCGHIFHRACLEPWLRQGHLCPLRCPAELEAAEAK